MSQKQFRILIMFLNQLQSNRSSLSTVNVNSVVIGLSGQDRELQKYNVLEFTV